MPELAEVEFYRREWNCGMGATITCVALHADKRVFRGTKAGALARALAGTKLFASESHGKQMAFRFTNGIWMGIHLGMTGELRVEAPDYTPGKHEHLVLFQGKRALVFADARQFGRIQFFQGKGEPPWWTRRAAPVLSREFTLTRLRAWLARHRKLPLKAALLNQTGFPGIGNWMADEILWQARMHPRSPAGALTDDVSRKLWKTVRFVARRSVETVAARRGKKGFGDPPRGWLVHERWSRDGKCPRHRTALRHDSVGGRTTAWCPKCQRLSEKAGSTRVPRVRLGVPPDRSSR